MLTENEVSRSWRALFQNQDDLSEQTFERAEALLEQLRYESPLRHRLTTELEAIRKLHT